MAWGDFSLVRVTLRLMALAVDTTDFDWFVLLSGQDYPIQPLARIETALRSEGVHGYISGVAVEEGVPCGPVECVVQRPGEPCAECVTRYTFSYYALPWMPGIGRIARCVGSSRIDRWINAHQPYVRVRPSFQRGLPTRLGFRTGWPFGPTMRLYKGSQWFSLHRDAVRYVLDFVRHNPGYVRHFRRTSIPDEAFFQTMLLNQPKLRMSRNNMRFVSWTDPWSPHPDILVLEDLPRLLQPQCHFARRFYVRTDAAILERLDEVLSKGSVAEHHHLTHTA